MLGWLLIGGSQGWLETNDRQKDACANFDSLPTLWACFWSSEPGYPELPGGDSLNDVFNDPAWNPISSPIPLAWLRSLKSDDGVVARGMGVQWSRP